MCEKDPELYICIRDEFNSWLASHNAPKKRDKSSVTQLSNYVLLKWPIKMGQLINLWLIADNDSEMNGFIHLFI